MEQSPKNGSDFMVEDLDSRIGGDIFKWAALKMPFKRRKKVVMGKKFLLIDQNLCQSLKDGKFQFLHRSSLVVVEVQSKEFSETDMQVDMSEVHISEPLQQLLEDNSMSGQHPSVAPNIKVQPIIPDPGEVASSPLPSPVSQAPDEQLQALNSSVE
ncbi:hypothetical protein ACSBR2_022144 [Camellia fascicularis]